ncbi:MAG: GTP-binding protein, partial [Terriglobales bacterium]
HKGREITLVDTAGIRRKSKVDYGIEAFSVVRSIRAIEHSDVTVVVLDGTQEIADQDQKIGAKVEEAGRAAVIVVNKWDLVENKSSRLMNEFIARTHTELRMLSFAEVVFTSAASGQRVNKILEAVERAAEQTRKRIGTGLINQVVNEATALVPAPSSKRGRRLKVYYTTQVSASPPTFVMFVNDAKLSTANYQTYIERKIREAFGFIGTPIRIIMRSKSETK